jgi:hypothetical protein
MIKHDSQGFLVGDLIDATSRLADGQERGLQTLARIDRNVASLAGARMSGRGGGAVSRRSPSSSGPARVVEPSGRGYVASRGGSANDSSMPRAVAQTVANEVARAVTRTQATRAAAITQIKRDAGGRFVKGMGKAGAPGGATSGGDGVSPSGSGGGLISTAASNIKDAASNAGSGIDPVVGAVGELQQVLEPLGRGWKYAFGRTGEQKKERWYKRFLKALERKPKDATSTTVVNQSGGGSMLGGLGGMGGGAMGLLSKGAGLAGGLLKRIPILGGLLAAGGVASALFSGDDPSKSKEENRSDRYKNVGQSVGAGAGMVAGAALGSLLGPAGTIAGGYLGTMLGEKVGSAMGEWTKSLVDSDIPGKVVDMAKGAWDKVAGVAGSIVDKGKAMASAAGDAVSGAATKANAAIKSAAGIDVGGAVSSAASATKQAAGKAVDTAKVAAGQAANFAVENAPKLVPQTVKNIGGWMLGKTSERYESGGKGAGTVSTGKGDLGGASYGTYQLASKTGTLDKFLQQSGYGDQFKGLKPGTPEFNAKWKQVAKDDPTFGDAQHSFIEKTHYQPQMDKLKKDGIDLSGRGAAVKDSVWSTSVQFGGGSSLIGKALKGKDIKSMSDADIVSAIQDYKAANNDKLFGSSSEAVRAGTLKRAQSEKAALLGLDSKVNTVAANGLTGSQSLASPTIPASTVAKIPPAPDASQPMAQASSKAEKPTVIVSKDVGQNVSDRAIAHKVTGGMGSA